MVPPGHIAIVDRDGLQLQKYWDLDFPAAEELAVRDTGQDLNTTVRLTRELLVSATMERLEAEAPLCFHLSGGLDSSTLLGIASRESGQRQTAFSITFEDGQYDEGAIAEKTAKSCHADWHSVRVSDRQLVEHLFPAARASEGLCVNGHLPAKFLLNREIRKQGFSAAITGEGADELFLGYAHFRMDWWKSQTIEFNQLDINGTNVCSLGLMLPYGRPLPLHGLSEILGFAPAFLQAKATLGARIHSLIREEVLSAWRSRADDAYTEAARWALATGQLSDREPVHQAAWLWTKLTLAGYILKTLGDGTEMASSVEGRLPFLDHRLFRIRKTTTRFLLDSPTTKVSVAGSGAAVCHRASLSTRETPLCRSTAAAYHRPVCT